MKPSVLLIEDDQELSVELAAYLDSVGFAVRCAATLAEARAMLGDAPELLVVDINLPDGNGLDLCSELDLRGVGIVMCTARDERELRIASLRTGADAYLVKPVDPEELEATLLCVHRRVCTSDAARIPSLLGAAPAERPWRLDAVDRLLTSPTGVAVLLSLNEHTLLKTLWLSDRRFATRDVLVERIDGVHDAGSAHRLEALVSRLRRKIHDKVGIKLPLRSEYGRGYSFAGHVQWSDQP